MYAGVGHAVEMKGNQIRSAVSLSARSTHTPSNHLAPQRGLRNATRIGTTGKDCTVHPHHVLLQADVRGRDGFGQLNGGLADEAAARERPQANELQGR